MSQPPPDTNPDWGEPTPPAAWATPGASTWTSPGGSPVDPPPTAVPPPPGPGYGPGPAGYGPGPGPAHGPAAGPWRPPALQPGIIPLRPLGLGELLDGTMRAVRFNPKVTFGLTAVVVTVCVTLATLLSWYVSGFFMTELRDVLGAGYEDVGGDSLILVLLSEYSATPFLQIATPLLTGLIIVAVSKAVLGQKVSVNEVLESGRIWALLGFSMLLFLVEMVAVLAVVGLVVLFASLGGGWSVAAVLVGVLGGLALMVAWAWLTVRTLLVPPALMLEGKGFWQTVARAWRLTRGSFWRLLGIYALVFTMLMILTSLVAYPLSMVVVVLSTVAPGWTALLANAVTLVLTATITTAFEAVVVALLYIDVRMRREGLDLELARAAAEVPAS